MAKSKTGLKKVSQEEKLNRGKLVGEIKEKYQGKNDYIAFTEALKKELGIEVMTEEIMASLIDEYEHYRMLQEFPAISQIGKKLPSWNAKGLVISSKLMPKHLFIRATQEPKVKYQVEFLDDLTVIARPIGTTTKE